ncbi:phosphotransferase [Mesobacillus subterraneus]|nr:phosphotransferase [Mesobacillus subterraneus]
MNINIKRGGDDFFFNRLFSYLNSELEEDIQGLTKLRGNVYLVQTPNSRFILKGYKDLRKLKIQEAFTSSLHKSGFRHSYRFNSTQIAPLKFHDLYYGCIEYIEPAEKSFHYANPSDRNEGVELLNTFHDITTGMIPSYAGLIPKVDLERKWHQRLGEFANNQTAISHYVHKDFIKELLQWAEFSLEEFRSHNRLLEHGRPAILHGDVAHHNFLRSIDGNLYLIDFDLISTGSRASDLLQYANRILPFLNWDFESLTKINHLNNWLENKAFLYGLIYPADILREWNRILRESNHINPYRLTPIVEMTVSQFQQRRQFLEQVKSRLK